MIMIKTPTGEIFRKADCIEYDDDLDNSEVFFYAENQEKLAEELFKNTGILVGELKGGENTG